MLTGVSLFAGVGGFDLAMTRNGIKTVATVEIDRKCNEILARHFPDAKQFTDVQQITGKDLIDAGFTPERGVITGGFPCQDLSVAGKRAGLAGARSGLFWEIRRLVEETQTEWFILENVPGLLSSNGGKDFGIILREMAELGYSIGWRVLDAQHFGVPQRRRRVFIIGSRTGGAERIGKVLFEREGLRRDTTQSQQEGQDFTRGTRKVFGQSSFAGYTEGPATLTATTYKRPEDNIVVMRMREGKPGGGKGPLLSENRSLTLATANDQTLFIQSSVRKLTPLECERLQGFPDNWTEGQTDTTRYKQMGNAVAVPVVEWIIQGIANAL